VSSRGGSDLSSLGLDDSGRRDFRTEQRKLTDQVADFTAIWQATAFESLPVPLKNPWTQEEGERDGRKEGVKNRKGEGEKTVIRLPEVPRGDAVRRQGCRSNVEEILNGHREEKTRAVHVERGKRAEHRGLVASCSSIQEEGWLFCVGKNRRKTKKRAGKDIRYGRMYGRENGNQLIRHPRDGRAC